MAKKTDANPIWHELEQQAYHAYREWHIWLMLRARELSERLGKRRPEGKVKPVEGEKS